MENARQKQEEQIKNLENAVVKLNQDLLDYKTISETPKKMSEKQNSITILQNRMLTLENLEDIKSDMAHTIEFRKYSEDEKQVLMEKYDIPEWNEDTKALLHVFHDVSKEIQGAKGYMTPEESKEFDKRFQTYLKEWLKTHEWHD
jgi:hypothetical protein